MSSAKPVIAKIRISFITLNPNASSFPKDFFYMPCFSPSAKREYMQPSRPCTLTHVECKYIFAGTEIKQSLG
jgi:hypothetical protein